MGFSGTDQPSSDRSPSRAARQMPNEGSMYEELVLAPRWMVWLGIAIAILGGLATASTMLEAERSIEERLVTSLATGIAAFVVGGVALIFTRLRITAGVGGVRFGFGPFASTLHPGAIEHARAGAYRWLRFGGWGLRWSWGGRDRAYSVPFVRDCVEIRLENGRSYVVSSRNPERLAEAVNALAASRDGSAAL